MPVRAPVDAKELAGQGFRPIHVLLQLEPCHEPAAVLEEDLQAALGVGKSQMSKYENGKELPKLETLARILDALEVEPIWFFYLMHQLSLEQPLESLKMHLLLRGSPGASMSKSASDGFLRLFGSVLDLHALLVEERAALEGAIRRNRSEDGRSGGD